MTGGGFETVPAAFGTPAGDCDRAASTLSDAAGALAAAVAVDTGDAGSSGIAQSVLQVLAAGVEGLGRTAAWDAAALRSTGATYAAAELSLLQGPPWR